VYSAAETYPFLTKIEKNKEVIVPRVLNINYFNQLPCYKNKNIIKKKTIIIKIMIILMIITIITTTTRTIIQLIIILNRRPKNFFMGNVIQVYLIKIF
jgi:hypothetical protein